MGFSITNIDSAPIKMNALVLSNVFGEENEVSSLIKRHHVDELKRNILRFVGASNLIGNPVNFVNSLGTGVDEFFYYPREGYVKGPLHAGYGIVRGTYGLARNTLIGVVGSAGGIVSSVSKGILHLSADKDYINTRDVNSIRNKPKNAL
jgi:vacuolar protein sorting-associated protein 13A/C